MTGSIYRPQHVKFLSHCEDADVRIFAQPHDSWYCHSCSVAVAIPQPQESSREISHRLRTQKQKGRPGLRRDALCLKGKTAAWKAALH